IPGWIWNGAVIRLWLAEHQQTSVPAKKILTLSLRRGTPILIRLYSSRQMQRSMVMTTGSFLHATNLSRSTITFSTVSRTFIRLTDFWHLPIRVRQNLTRILHGVSRLEMVPP